MPILIAVAMWQWAVGGAAAVGTLAGAGYAVRRWGVPKASEKLKSRKARKQAELEKAEEDRILAIYREGGVPAVEAHLYETGQAKNQRHGQLLIEAMQPWLEKATAEAEAEETKAVIAAVKSKRAAKAASKEAAEEEPTAEAVPLKVVGRRRHTSPEAAAHAVAETAEG